MRNRLTRCFAAASALALTLVQAVILPQRTVSASEVPDFSSLGAVGTLTQAQTVAVAESIYTNLAAHSEFAAFSLEEQNIPAITPTTENMNSLMNVFMTVIGGWDVGILAKKNSSNCIIESNGKTSRVKGMAIYYLTDDESYDEVYADVMEQLDSITAGVDPSWSAPEKALYLHEYMACHFDYDHEAAQGSLSTDEERLCFTAYGILKHGKAVCEGYTWLYNILLRRVGIESLAVTSVELNHAWNVLNIDGYWYHVDVTWDDYNDTHPGYVVHTSFLKERNAMRSSGHSSSDWTLSTGKPESELKESTKYNTAFWKDIKSAIQPYQNKWLAVHSQITMGWFNLYDFDAATGTAEYETLTTQSQVWKVWDREAHYSESYIIPSVNCGTIYYTTPQSIMALQNGTHVWIYNLTEEQAALGYIYGMYTDGDMLYYTVSQSPNAAAQQFSIDLTDYRDRVYTEGGASSETTVATTAPAATTTAAATKATTSVTAKASTATTTTAVTKATTTAAATKAATAATTKAPAATTTTAATKATTATTTKAPASTTTTAAVKTTTSATTKAPAATTTTAATKATTAATTKAPAATTTAAATKATTSATTKAPVVTTTAAATKATTSATTKAPAATTTTATTEPSTELPGDADGDGILTVQDVIALNRYLLGSLKLEEAQLAQLDLCKDGSIDVFDLVILKRMLLGIV